jgi:hypothetical protein
MPSGRVNVGGVYEMEHFAVVTAPVLLKIHHCMLVAYDTALLLALSLQLS